MNGHHPTGIVTPPLAVAVVEPPVSAAPKAEDRQTEGLATQAVGTGAPGTATLGTSATELEAFLINFVVEQTGYPAEVVDLDADLEADLGIDSIKKAQLFGELREHLDIGAMTGNAAGGNLSLDDFTTLRHVLNFLVSSAPATGGVVAQPSTAPLAEPSPEPVAAEAAVPEAECSEAATAEADGPTTAAPGTSAAELEAFLINFVVEQTGYPAEVVDLDADLEADLGIDSIKKAQLFGELREYFDIGAMAGNVAGGNLSLDDFTTLRHVLDFLVQSQPGTASTAGIDRVVATTYPAPPWQLLSPNRRRPRLTKLDPPRPATPKSEPANWKPS